jgi:hypothetical protein
LDRRPTRALAAIGGVPRLLVPDNAKVAVIKACLDEPQVNRTYAEMAAHYGTAVLPTRPHRPRDKAKGEVAVLVVERWILARLRHRQFYSLAELNAAIAELLKRLNEEKPLRPCCHQQRLPPCCSGRCSPPARSTCARSTAGKHLPQLLSITQLTSPPQPITSCRWRLRHIEFQHKARRHQFGA